MKKIAIMALLLVLILSFTVCGEKNEDQLVERSIEGIASYLGYTDGEEISPAWNEDSEVTGAKRGKLYSFKYGKVAIYEFDPESREYQYWEYQTTDCIEGFVLLYEYDDLDKVTDREMLDEGEKIQSIRFK